MTALYSEHSLALLLVYSKMEFWFVIVIAELYLILNRLVSSHVTVCWDVTL
jgi:hypothetical protein